MRVIIIGGGIGGIGLANALLKLGIEPIVLEQAPVITSVGAGIVFTANGMRVLSYLDCDKHVRDTGVKADQTFIHDLNDGERLLTVQMGGSAAKEYGDFAYHVHRADLLSALQSKLPSRYLRLGCKVVDVDETTQDVRVRLESGEVIVGDIAVGADGIRSMVRERLFGSEQARFTNTVAWRAVFPTSGDLPAVNNSYGYFGKGRGAVFYSICSGAMHNFVGFCPAAETGLESWTATADPAELRHAFADACEEVQRMCTAVTAPFITPIYFRNPLASWSSQRCTLLGDAAHPAQPTVGNGAQLALEDGITLAHCLSRHGRTGIAQALEEYQARRLPRCTRAQLAARIYAHQMWEGQDPAEIRARNKRFKGYQQIDPIGQTMFGWLYKFDAVNAAELPLDAQPQSSVPLVNPMIRPEARSAFDLWRGAISPEDHARGWLGQRDAYERLLLKYCSVDVTQHVTEVDCGGIPALRVSHRDDGGPVIMHLHGGAWVMGSASSAVGLAGRLARAINGRAYAIDYRLAPEHGFPAALEDARQAFRALAKRYGANNIIVTGECAGGGLALSLALALRDANEPLPRALYVTSPFCDMSLTSSSIDRARDPLFDRRFLTELTCAYIQDTDFTSPLVSPLHADLSGLPRLLVHAAEDEALRDDAEQLVQAAERAGVAVTARMLSDTVHSFVLFPFLSEAEEALNEFAQFASSDRACEASILRSDWEN